MTDLCLLIDGCPSECGLIKAVFAEVDAVCRECPEREAGCLESCLAYRLLRLVPAHFDFEGVCTGGA